MALSVFEVFDGEDARVFRLPVDSIDEPGDQVKVLAEVTFILLWILAVVGL